MTTEDKVECPYCKGTKWLIGPSGGAATNVMCANPECGHWFNNSVFGMDDLHEVGNERRPDDKREDKREL